MRAITLPMMSSRASSEIADDPTVEGDTRRPCSAERRAANASASDGTDAVPGNGVPVCEGASDDGFAITEGVTGAAVGGLGVGGGVWTGSGTSAAGRGGDTGIGAAETASLAGCAGGSCSCADGGGAVADGEAGGVAEAVDSGIGAGR